MGIGKKRREGLKGLKGLKDGEGWKGQGGRGGTMARRRSGEGRTRRRSDGLGTEALFARRFFNAGG